MDGMMTRKEFLKSLGLGVPAVLCLGEGWAFSFSGREDIRGHVFKGEASSGLWKWSIEGFHYASNGTDVQCHVCPNRCYLTPGDRSVCRSKINLQGKLYSLAYGNPCAVHVDPIEKKPLNHFYPGTSVFSVAIAGCNLRCLNCQNWEMSQRRPEDVQFSDLFPPEAVKQALENRCPSIAYTYSEAVTYYEYTFDTSRLAREAGVKNVFVSNGYINRDPLIELCKYLDGANINLKSFDDRIYRALNGGTLQPVLDTLKTLHERGVWFEVTTLVVPTYVDDPEMIKRMCGWILDQLGPDYPLHFSRFYPLYKLTRLPPTPITTLEQFREIALKEGLHYVYVGNVPGHKASHTYCHHCGKLILERKGYSISRCLIDKGRCQFCGTVIPGRWGTDE
jgi:pyruvate formate lyase activating enzyme